MECRGKVLIDEREGFLEFLFADLIELRDGLLRICNGLQQIVPFAAEESEPLFAFVVFLERHHIANPPLEAPRPKAGQGIPRSDPPAGRSAPRCRIAADAPARNRCGRARPRVCYVLRGNRRAFAAPSGGRRPPASSEPGSARTPAPSRCRALPGAVFRRAAIGPDADVPRFAPKAVPAPAPANLVG